MSEILTGSGLEDPAADFRVDRVAGTEQLHEMAGIRQADAPGRGELASRTGPGQERADLTGEFRFPGGVLQQQYPYRGRGEYSDRAREVAGAIADMIESGGAADAVPLARRAVERVTAAMLQMDDSSGIIGDDLRVLTVLYARACRAAPPDQKQLAAWLVKARLDGPGCRTSSLPTSLTRSGRPA
jgi:hypothetical protein